MSVFIGRKFNIGIGRESSRGTAVAATYWLPKMDGVIDDRIDTVQDDSSIGIIEDAQGGDITKKYAVGNLQGRISDLSFGLVLLATLGTDTVGAVETGVKDHVFTILESAQHPSLTIDVHEPNATNLRYPLGMIDALEITFAVNAYAGYKMDFTANTPTTSSNTPSFTAENIFTPAVCTAKIASNLAGLGAASVISVRTASIKISKNTEDDPTIGSLSPVDRYNRQFVVEGTIELVYNDRSAYTAVMLADTAKALRLQAISPTLIGAASYPTLTIDLAKVKLVEVSNSVKNDEIVLQTLKFKAYYSIADTSMISITLRNTVTAAYSA